MDNAIVSEVVMKLVGPVKPIGDSYADEIRLNNLKHLTAVIDTLLHEVTTVAGYRNSFQSSLKLAGRTAKRYLNELGECYYSDESEGE
jgi:hypothetical protein